MLISLYHWPGTGWGDGRKPWWTLGYSGPFGSRSENWEQITNLGLFTGVSGEYSSFHFDNFSLSVFLNRLVHSGPGKGSPQAGVDLSFATRTGTRQGIETHLFRAEISRDLSHWTRSIVQGCHNSAELTIEVTTGEHCWLWFCDVTSLWKECTVYSTTASKLFPLLAI